MNSTDERLRAAARDAMGIFPPDSDLPPLRLPDPACGYRRARVRASARAGAGRIGRARAWLAPIAAATAVALVIAGAVVLHQSTSRATSGSLARQRANAGLAKSLQRQQQALDALVVEAFVPATGPQYDSGSKLMWLVQAQVLRATAECMAASGYHISDQPAPFTLAMFADNTQMPDLPRIARTHQFVGPAEITSASYPEAEQQVYNTCHAKAEGPYQLLLMTPGQALEGSWWKVIFRIQASAQVQAAIPALATCAARAGYPSDPYGSASGPLKSFTDFVNWVAGFLDGAGSRGASASTLRSLARHWSAVFVTCAGPIVGVWQRMQLAAQPGFLEQHASQVRQLDQVAWQLLGRQSR
jgi:hypothetical protein